MSRKPNFLLEGSVTSVNSASQFLADIRGKTIGPDQIMVSLGVSLSTSIPPYLARDVLRKRLEESGLVSTNIGCIYVLAHCCIHLVGIIQHLLSQVRRRSTFMRLGHNAVMRKALEKEQRMRKDMIQSLMPLQVAEEVMRGVGKQSDEDDGSMDEEAVDVRSPSHSSKTSVHNRKSKKSQKPVRVSEVEMDAVATNSNTPRKRHSFFDEDNEDDEMDPLKADTPDGEEKAGLHGGSAEQWSISSEDQNLSPTGPMPVRAVRFRKFHVSQMENVSILFADIVGFTKMSSNKSASHLVYLLNDLFGRFDSLCELTKCEKIATLGDCYYCVSGCPNSVDDHAERIVEMGRAMCLAIQQFDNDHNEQVNMRVGVHTGKVICGLVGTRRFKFDVWSNDVTLANKMESSGEAGKVHISEATLEFVKEIYEVSEAEPVPDIRQIKVLVEFFNKEEQRYAIKHTQDQAPTDQEKDSFGRMRNDAELSQIRFSKQGPLEEIAAGYTLFESKRQKAER
nr:unnamed protein product [Spirometra erinaceieuropaei]